MMEVFSNGVSVPVHRGKIIEEFYGCKERARTPSVLLFQMRSTKFANIGQSVFQLIIHTGSLSGRDKPWRAELKLRVH